MQITLDFRPGLTQEILQSRLKGFRERESQSGRLRRLGLSPAARWLLREATPPHSGAGILAQQIKSCPLDLVAPDSLARAISTAGGVRREALDDG